MLQLSMRRDYVSYPINAISPLSARDSLQRWLEGRWALLFSHPQDFGSTGFEADRWLVYVRAAFVNLRVVPIAMAQADADRWISQVGGRFIPPHAADDLLPADGPGISGHFITILDSTLRARRTLLYTPGEDVPCAIELAHTAAQVRARGAPKSVHRILKSVQLAPSPGGAAVDNLE